MNPFDLTGPEFLVFYLVFGAVLALVAWMVQLLVVKDVKIPPGITELTDPYAIAYLRGGVWEAWKVATFSLMDRGLLKGKIDKSGFSSITPAPDADMNSKRFIEKLVLNHFTQDKTKLSPDKEKRDLIASAYDADLAGLGLVFDSRSRMNAVVVSVLFGLVVVSTGVIKIGIALDRGHHNILFLVGFIGVFAVTFGLLTRRRRTTAGRQILQDLDRYYSRLRSRSSGLTIGGTTNEAAILAAVFGLGALSAIQFPFVSNLNGSLDKAKQHSQWISTGCSGSGCSGGGCGGGCGGGGCGGCG